MATENILIDTSIIIDFLRKKDKATLPWEIRAANHCYLSVITLFELYAGATTDLKILDVDKIAA